MSCVYHTIDNDHSERSRSIKISLSDRASTKVFICNVNKCKLIKVKIDKIISDSKACDWLVGSSVKAVIVELKSSDIKSAFLQIESTVGQLREELGINCIRHAYIVTRCVPLSRVALAGLRSKYERRLGIEIKPVRHNTIINIMF